LPLADGEVLEGKDEIEGLFGFRNALLGFFGFFRGCS
jgi:hypothetical protein